MHFLNSPYTLSALAGLFIGQILKMPLGFLRDRKWDWSLLLNAGGMPSSHSSLMTAITTTIGFYEGWGSALFALALAITGIVVYDAAGVRRQSGLHAERINLIVKEFIQYKRIPEDEIQYLKEVIGHSPPEAIGGVVLGVLISVAIRLLIPPL